MTSSRTQSPPLTVPGGRSDEGRYGLAAVEERLLIASAQACDERAFAELVRRHTPRMYAAAMRLLGDPALAEEAVQEAWVAGWRGLGTFAGRSALSTWLYRLVLVAAWRLASLGRRAPGAAEAEVLERTGPDVPSAESSATDRAQQDAVRAAVRALDDPLRRVVELYHFAGLSYAEITTIVGAPEATVRGRLYRGRRQLAATLREWRRDP